MTETFSRPFRARWGDMDFNAHMANTAILDVAPDTRLMYFEAQGFPASELRRRGIGPVILEDRVEYRKEIRLLDPFEVTFEVAGLSADGKRFRMRNDLVLPDGTIAARITSLGCWFDHESRRMTVPPPELARIMEEAPRSEDYEAI